MLPFVLSFVAGQVSLPSNPFDITVGRGTAVEKGSRYTIAYRVTDLSGKSLANSDSRGLPFSKELGDGHDGYFDAWVQGMNAGGVRRFILRAEDVPKEFGDLVPRHSDLVVMVKLLGVRRATPQ